MSDLQKLPGLVATVCTSGSVKPQYAASFSNMRSFNDRNGWHKVEYRTFAAAMVESGRDATVQHALEQKYEWLLQIDADAAPFRPDAVAHFVKLAFQDAPWYDVIGAYCQLKGETARPTIDTGSGKWEEHYPGEGLLPVIRTGAHFLFCKTNLLRRMGPPWFRTRQAIPPLRALKEVDNFCRTHFGGTNPLKEHPEWETIFAHATKAGDGQLPVGEDSGFCDNVMAVGGRIAVDTDFVVGHVADQVLMPDAFVKFMEGRRRMQRMALGVME